MSVNYQFPKSYQPNANYVAEEFFGRTDDLCKVITLVQNEQNVCLTGLRRIGRTWFLNHLANLASQDTDFAKGLLIPQKVDVTVLANFSPAEAVDKILLVIQNALRGLGWIGNTRARFGEDSWNGFFDAFEFFAPILDDHEQKLVLLLDEVEALAKIYDSEGDGSGKHSSLANKLRHVLDSVPQYRLIIVTHIPLATALSDLSTSLPARFTNLAFCGIDADATVSLLRSREQVNGIRYTPEAQHRVYALSGGHPLFIRMIGEHIVNSGTSGDVTSKDIDAAFKMVLIKGAPYLETDYFRDTNTFHKRILNELAKDTDRTVSDLRKLMPAELEVAHFSQYYRDLTEMGLLIPDNALGYEKPHFANEFLKAYIQGLIGQTYQLPPTLID
jgi:hypothetical protein